jgi:hypothetical protein
VQFEIHRHASSPQKITGDCNANALLENDLADGTNRDGKNLSRTHLLTSFPTDPLKGTSLAIQDSDALKDPLQCSRAAAGHESARFLE